MAETRTRLTADDLLRLPDSGSCYELVDGELIEMWPPGGEHGYVAGEALYRVRSGIEGLGLGGAVFAAETGFRLSRDPDTVRAADVAYVSEARLAQARVPGYPEMAPDLVVEVVSPGDTASEVQRKVEDWLRAGTRIVWVLYPWPTGEAGVLHADDFLDGAPVLPGFTCRVGNLF
jgi:Uma2 family endonuclease